jgi:hypothetical protein
MEELLRASDLEWTIIRPPITGCRAHPPPTTLAIFPNQEQITNYCVTLPPL